MIDLETIDLATLEATMDTAKGTMVIGFYPEKAPGHVRNFAKLAQEGFYDGLAFHRIIKSFMIQGGCPNTKEGATGHPGTGGPGYQIEAEFSDLPHKRGVLSMARSSDPNSAGSQFFVVHGEHVASLDGQYTVFGYLKEGHDVLDEIAGVEVTFAGGERSKPADRVGIERVSVRTVELPAETPPE
ncbi:MAG: peptidylprolyl isomerase [Planctomycetota bacterium]